MPSSSPHGLPPSPQVDSIAHASPATISRCGIVYMDKATDLWRPIICSWTSKVCEKGGVGGDQGHGWMWWGCHCEPLVEGNGSDIWRVVRLGTTPLSLPPADWSGPRLCQQARGDPPLHLWRAHQGLLGLPGARPLQPQAAAGQCPHVHAEAHGQVRGRGRGLILDGRSTWYDSWHLKSGQRA